MLFRKRGGKSSNVKVTVSVKMEGDLTTQRQWSGSLSEKDAIKLLESIRKACEVLR